MYITNSLFLDLRLKTSSSSRTLPNRIRSTDLALSFWCLNRTRPLLSSTQVKVSSLVSSWPGFPRPPLSSPSSPLNRTNRPLLGPWTSWKISRSDGLSGSFTCSRVGGNGAKPPRGTSREPLTWRAGGWVFTEKTREDRKRKESWNRWSLMDLKTPGGKVYISHLWGDSHTQWLLALL